LRQRYVNNRINITDTEVDQFLAQQKVQGNSDSEYHLGHILIDLPEAPSAKDIDAAKQRGERILQLLAQGQPFAQVAMSNSDGQLALSGGDLGWRKLGELPSLFAKTVAGMKPGQTSGLIRSPSGLHILRLIEKRGGDRHVVSQTHARHILIKTNELVDDTTARKRLQDLKDRLQNGEDFATLARAHSDDKASAAKGGDLGWVSPGQMVPSFESAMDSLQPGQISEPFQSRFGWHIVQVLERRKHDDTEKFYRNQARKQLFQRKAAEEEELWLRRLRDEAYIEKRL
jgi:peptidyl-prolyl cis-trans isomerase SurA